MYAADLTDIYQSPLGKHSDRNLYPNRAEAKLVTKRFVRSVIRVFVVFNVEMSPAQGKKRSLQSATQPLQRCKRVFQVRIAYTACIFLHNGYSNIA